MDSLCGVSRQRDLAERGRAGKWDRLEPGLADCVAPRVASVFPIGITVCGFAELAGLAAIGVSHVLSVLDPGTRVASELDAFPAQQRLERRFHDVIEPLPGTAPPTRNDIRRILALGET
jgi:hypothetical protein